MNTVARKAPLPDSWRLALEFHHRGGACWVRCLVERDAYSSGRVWVGGVADDGPWLLGRDACVAVLYGQLLRYVDSWATRDPWAVWPQRDSRDVTPVARLFDGVRLVEISGPRAVTLAEWRRETSRPAGRTCEEE